jgi:hypothetical protein
VRGRAATVQFNTGTTSMKTFANILYYTVHYVIVPIVRVLPSAIKPYILKGGLREKAKSEGSVKAAHKYRLSCEHSKLTD